MPSSRILRRATTAAAGGLALVLAGTTLAAPASAYQPSAQLANAVEAKRSTLSQAQIYANFFWVTDLDGLPGADGTPDGYGAFQWYAGNNGSGAIYTHQKWGSLWTHTLYGSILSAWSANGYEYGKGFPMSDEYNATSNDVSNGCPAGTLRVQRFSRANESGNRRACWNPSFSSPYNVYWTS